MFEAKTLSLNDSLRQQLKKPLGILVTGSRDKCNEYLRSKIAKEKPPRLILVGDMVSRNALRFGLQPHVIIIDNREMRRTSSSTIMLDDRRQFSLFNAQGSINASSWRLINQAVKNGNSAVIVDGEEDLLSLVAVSVAPVGALVVYGQPKEGIVIVNVTPESKRMVMRILEHMEATSA